MIKQVVKENNGPNHPILLIEAAIKACDRNQNVQYHLIVKEEGNLDILKQSYNHLSITCIAKQMTLIRISIYLTKPKSYV